MDINIGETPAGRIKMELFSDAVPKCVFPLLKPRTLDVRLTRRSFICKGLQRTSDSYAPESTGRIHPLASSSTDNES
jgi:hypothetical protein